MLVVNGKSRNDGPTEDFGISREPLDGSPINPPEQLELKPKPKKDGTFTRNARRLLKRSGPKRGGPNAD